MSIFKDQLKYAVINKENPETGFSTVIDNCKSELFKAAEKGLGYIEFNVNVVHGAVFSDYLNSLDLDYTLHHINSCNKIFPERLIYFIELPKYN